MADLVVDYGLLGQTESSLRSLISEFANIKTQEDAYSGAWGSGDIAAAMGGFSGNWDYHRQKLQHSMESLGKMVAQCRASFQKVDTGLASDLTHGH
jgi:uncharacterized protein YukE